MNDLLYIGLFLVILAATFGLLRACERLMPTIAAAHPASPGSKP
jgi:hypothetical protein